jgi:uncharacterized protein YdeI (YjbR/CyaY-like superfamily)
VGVKPTFFATPELWRRWLQANHARVPELLVGFYKRGSDRPSMTWPESVDQALCFGWIDGVRRSHGDDSYTIRFTPRQVSSTWSAVNIKKVEALSDAGLMQPAGLQAFEARTRKKSEIYSYENKHLHRLGADYENRLKTNAKAWKFFEAQPPWYRRTASFWVISAKKEETRLKRLAALIDASAKGCSIGPLERKPVRASKRGQA